MMKELFLMCALALPSGHHTQPRIVDYHEAPTIIAQRPTWIDENELTEWIKKNNPGAEVFITDKSHPEKMREYGWIKYPATINNKDIWINPKPKTDQKRLMEAA